MDAVLTLSLLGPFEARIAGAPASLSSRKSRAMLGMLAAAPGMSVSRIELCETLWGGRGEEQARASLRQEIAALRKALGEAAQGAVLADAERVALAADAVETDLALLLDPDADPHAALAAVRGPFLDGLDLRDPGFDDWLDATRRRIDARVAEAARRLGHDAMARGDWGQLAAAADHLLRLSPFDEAAMCWRLEALAGEGRRAAALDQLAAFERRLSEELGVHPAPELEALKARLTRATPAEAPAAAEPPGETDVLGRPAVLFLPFEALSQSEDDALLASGLCEDIRTTLACWRSFPVIGPEALGGQTGDIQHLAAAVSASYAVTGSVRRAGNRARVIARLIDAASGRELWSQSFDGELADVFDFQEEVSRLVVSQIEPEITQAAAGRTPVARPRDLAVWELLARAADAERRGGDGYGTREANEAQRGFVLQAVERDPENCEAWARLGRTHLRDFLLGWTDDPAAALENSLAASARSLELNPQNSLAQAFRAQSVLFGNHDPATAATHAEEAVRLNPSNIFGHLMVGCTLVYLGEFERSFDHYEKALRLNPNFPNKGTVYCDQMMCRALAGDLDGAVTLARRTMGVAPNYARGLQRCAAVLAQAGLEEEAQRALRRLEAAGGAFSEAYLRTTYPFRRPEDAEFLIEGLRKAGWTG